MAFASQANSNQQNSGGFVAPQSAITTTEQGGFKGPSISETTVAKAKTLSDDTWVILTGKITKKLVMSFMFLKTQQVLLMLK